MEEKKVDRRVVKTKRAIYNAMAQLLSERDVKDITIRELVDIADINRKTFYTYYSGIYALLDEIENTIVDIFEETLGEIDFRESLHNPKIMFENLNEVLNSNLEFYGHLISMKSNTNLITKIVKVMKGKTREAMIKQIPEFENNADIILDYVFSGMLAVYQSWFLSEQRPPIEAVSETLSLLCFGGINSVLEKENGRKPQS